MSTDCAGGRDARAGAKRDGRGRVGAARGASALRAPALRAVEAASRLAERRGGATVLGGRPRIVARAAIQCGLVRRARQMAEARGDLGHAAIRIALRRGAAPGGDHHAQAGEADQVAARRSFDRGEPGRDRRQRRQSRAVVPPVDRRALSRHAARPAGARRRAAGGSHRRALAARADRAGSRGCRS